MKKAIIVYFLSYILLQYLTAKIQIVCTKPLDRLGLNTRLHSWLSAFISQILYRKFVQNCYHLFLHRFRIMSRSMYAFSTARRFFSFKRMCNSSRLGRTVWDVKISNAFRGRVRVILHRKRLFNPWADRATALRIISSLSKLVKCSSFKLDPNAERYPTTMSEVVFPRLKIGSSCNTWSRVSRQSDLQT
jgi:hypothetical protein